MPMTAARGADDAIIVGVFRGGRVERLVESQNQRRGHHVIAVTQHRDDRWAVALTSRRSTVCVDDLRNRARSARPKLGVTTVRRGDCITASRQGRQGQGRLVFAVNIGEWNRRTCFAIDRESNGSGRRAGSRGRRDSGGEDDVWPAIEGSDDDCRRVALASSSGGATLFNALTVCVRGTAALPPKLGSPLYVAVIVWGPTERSVIGGKNASS